VKSTQCCGGFAVNAKSTHCGGFTAKSTHCGGFNAKSTHCGGFTAKSTHCGGFTVNSTQCGGFNAKSTQCGGFLSLLILLDRHGAVEYHIQLVFFMHTGFDSTKDWRGG
jgi:hypothetical protein